MTVKANQDIRDYMDDRGVTQIDLGDRLGVHNGTISKMLAKLLPEHKKEQLIQHIDAIAEEKKRGAVREVQETNFQEEAAEESGTKFRIGDRVKIPSKQLTIGVVADIWHSLGKNAVMYAVTMEGGSTGLYNEDQLEPAPLPITYHFNAVIEGNVAVVTMHGTQGDKEWVISRGHAHILHDGEVGMAQAVSYAARRMFEAQDRQNDNKIYFKREDMK